MEWSELFGDLILVAIAMQITIAIHSDLSWATLGTTFAMYTSYLASWLHMATYMSRYGSQDLVFKIGHVRLNADIDTLSV